MREYIAGLIKINRQRLAQPSETPSTATTVPQPQKPQPVQKPPKPQPQQPVQVQPGMPVAY